MKTDSASKSDIMSPRFWKSASKSNAGESTNRKCMTAECWDRAAEGYDDLDSCHDYITQVESVITNLKDSGMLTPETSVLDVACGTGTYAVRMAPYCKFVTCLDISRGMLEKLRIKQERAGLDNIEIIHGDWHVCPMKKKFDLVFCSMSPLLRSMDNVDGLLDCSSRHAAFVTWAGIRENVVLNEIGMKVLARKPGKHTTDINVIFNYLYALGLAPELRFFRGCWEKRREVEKQIRNVIWRLEMYRPLDKKEKEYISDYVKKHAEDGMMAITTRVRTVLIMVDKEADNFRC